MKRKMRNLLLEPMSEDELRDIFAACPPVPLLPLLGDARWQECAGKPVTQALLAAIEPRARTEARESLPELSDDLYREYHRSGNRLKFETVYFERRRRLARTVFCALFAPDGENWIPVVFSAWDEILGETSWALPAHVADQGGRDPMVMDLFAAETANLMGELLNVFAAHVESSRRESIEARLREQFFLNYLHHPERRGWAGQTHNWNAVCHQGVLGAALALESDADLLARLFFQAAGSLGTFLSGFTPDGGCSEGPGYWGYGFGWFAVLNEQLETRTRGALSLFEGNPLIAEIARFGRRAILAPHCIACFSDGSPHELPRASLLAYLDARLNDAGNREQAATQYAALAEAAPNLDELRADVFFLFPTVLKAPANYEPLHPAAFENVYLPSLAWWISHGCDKTGTRWALAAKGGHNAEHHNHNDCGSFILVLNDHFVIDEIGAPQYERDFFSNQRYNFLAARTIGHSLPIINGCEQQAGSQFAAQVVKATFGAAFDEFSLDLTACYPREAQCWRYLRTWRVQREPFAVELVDEFEMDAGAPEGVSIECALVTHGNIEVREDGIILRVGDERLRIETDAAGARFLRCEEHDYAHRGTGEPAWIKRLVFAPGVVEGKPQLKLRLSAA